MEKQAGATYTAFLAPGASADCGYWPKKPKQCSTIMQSKLSRRSLLADVPAVAAVAVMPALSAGPVDDSETLDAVARWQRLYNEPLTSGSVESYRILCRVLPQLRPQTIEGAVAPLGCAAVRVHKEDAHRAGDKIPDILYYSDWTTKRILLASHDALQRLSGGAS